MSAETPRSVSVSIRAYHQLLRVYPKAFQARFGEPLVQAFGDLARRALSRGGALQLVLLWMRMLPDLGISAVREHASGARWLRIRSVRLRWAIACACGFAIGSAAGDPVNAAGVLGSWVVSLVFQLAVYSGASPPFGFELGYLFTGLVFGCLTGFPLATMLGPGRARHRGRGSLLTRGTSCAVVRLCRSALRARTRPARATTRGRRSGGR